MTNPDEILKHCRTLRHNGTEWISKEDLMAAMAGEIKVTNMPELPTLTEILNEVSRRTFVSVERIKGRERHRHIVTARQIYFYYARKHTTHSLAEIGSLVNKDHATTLHGIKVIENVKEAREYYQELFEGKKPEPRCITLPQVIENKALLIGAHPIRQVPEVRVSKYRELQSANNQPYSGYREHQL